jgi:hypothetical protein
MAQSLVGKVLSSWDDQIPGVSKVQGGLHAGDPTAENQYGSMRFFGHVALLLNSRNLFLRSKQGGASNGLKEKSFISMGLTHLRMIFTSRPMAAFPDNRLKPL